jgi:hypothetical protein
MKICGNCGQRFDSASQFCSGCGAQLAVQAAPKQQYTPNPSQSYPAQTYPAQHSPQTSYPTQQSGGWNPHHVAARGFAQTFGLHPAMALLTVVVNTMVFVVGWGTLGVGWLTSIPIGVVIGIITYMGQKKWYGDDHESALIKALIVAFLTAIPTSLPGYLTIPAGVIGLFRKKG